MEPTHVGNLIEHSHEKICEILFS